MKMLVGVPGQVRVDFKAHIPVLAAGAIIERAELVRGHLHIFDGQRFEDFLYRFALPLQLLDVLLIIRAVGDSLLENRRVRGHAAQAVLLDEPPQPAAGHQITMDVVQPDRLAEFG